jgi:uncharacterized membrane protein YeiB
MPTNASASVTETLFTHIVSARRDASAAPVAAPNRIVQLAIAPIWLRHFEYGPLAWLWRSLKYWKPQRMRLAVASSS